MNGPFQVAQANISTQTSGKPPARIVKVTKPFGDQSVVVPLSYDGSVKADLSSIAGENITLVHIGEKLIILFDNKSTVTLEPFFDSNGKPLDSLTVEVSPGRDLTGTEFAALFPVTEDRSILPAAGDGNGPGAQASGANFTSVGVDPLAAPNPLDLLGQENLPNFTINTLLNQNTFINGIPTASLTGVVALDEDEIPGVGGNPGGPNDAVAPYTFSGTLNHDFGLDLAGDINFAAMNGATQTINGITVTFTWNQATHTLIANDGSHDVFEVVITNPGTGEYTVTLLGALHHHTDALADNTEDGATFNLTFTVQDSNGTTANSTLTININDDTPVAHDSAPTNTTIVVGGESPSGEGGNGETVTKFATIDDEGQVNGNSGNAANGDDPGEATSVSGKLDIAPGADGLKAVSFTGLDGAPHVTVTADNGSHPTLRVIFVDPQTGLGTPENVTISWQSDGNGGGTLIGTSDHFSANNPAFTLTVDAQGNYTFDVHAPFAHPLTSDGSEGSSQIGWEDNLHVQFTYTATDGDGDKSSATLTFNIDDDTPTIVVTTNEGEGGEGQLPLLVSLDESIGGDRGSAQSPTDGASDDTGHTQPDPTGTNPIGEMKTAAGDGEMPGGLQSLFNVIKSPGADGEKSTTYSYGFSLTGAGQGGGDGEVQGQNEGVATSLKATGYADGTIYLFQEDATHIVGRVGGENGDIAIRITLSDANNLSGGQLVVDQYLAIDHGNDGNNFDSMDLLKLASDGGSLGVTLTTTITDGDGDQATGSATIVLANSQSSSIGFQDDGPAPLAISAANAAANGLFFDGFTPNNDQWGTGSGVNTSATAGAWHIGASTHDGATNIQLERVGDGYRGADSPTDSVMVDMEATPGNLKLTQDVGGLTPGEVYHLTFEIGAASDAAVGSAKLEVFWNGVSVGTYDPTSGVMQTISIDVTATGGNNQLTFEEIGTSGDNTGTFLANVKLADVVIIDETKGVDADSDDTTGLGALFATVTNVGVDPNMDQPQYAQGKHPVIVLGTPDFGTDGPAATNPIQVGLTVSAQGVDSGLTTTAGQHIYLFVENGLVVGRFDADNDAGHTPETAAFALSIDGNGNLSIAQYVSLHQPVGGSSHDEGVYLNNGTVSATVTLTDGDGDHTTSSADISSAIRFEDDGPSIDAAQNSSLRDWTVDEDVLAHGNDQYDNPADTNDYTVLSNKDLGVNWGADGAKALTFTATDSTHPTITITDQNGAPVAGGLSSGGVALTYEVSTDADGGQTLIAYKGNVHSAANEVFTLKLDPDAGTSGTFSFELKAPLDHPNGGGENTLNLNFGFTATDGDGDTASSSVTIRITDDVPVASGEVINRTVAEDDINTAWSHGTSPSDGSADGSLTEGSTGAAIVTGSLAGLVSGGSDLPGKFGFAGNATQILSDLHLFSKQTATGNGENGKELIYQTSNGPAGSHEIIITGYEPNPQGNPVFSLTLNTETGAYEFRLYDELIHMPGDGQNDDLRSGQPVDGVQHSIPNLDLGSIITYTDKDGDSVGLGGKFTVTITDDVPHADIDLAGGSVVVDESGGNNADNTTSSSVRNLFAALEATFVNGQRLVGQDPDVPGDHNGSNSGNGAIAYAHSDGAVVSDDSTIGSDSPPYAHQYALSITNGPSSGLFTTDGSAITLSMSNGMIIGTVVGGEFNGKVAFAVAIGSDGEVSVAQYLSIRHDDRGDPNESNDNGSNNTDASPNDTPNPIQQSLDGKIAVTLTVTDSDGDTSTDTVNIGKQITFLDDGPSVNSNSTVVLDDDNLPGGNAGGPGDDNAPQNAHSTLAHDYGADGPGSTLLTGFNLPSGLGFSASVSSDGLSILIKQNGTDVLKIQLTDSTHGEYQVTQLHAIDHPTLNGQNGDDTENNVQFTVNYRVTDGDGDTANGSININVDDDTPEPNFVLQSGKLVTIDETPGLQNATATPGVPGDATDNDTSNPFPVNVTNHGTPGTGSTFETTAAQSNGAVVAVTPHYGADGPGSTVFNIDVSSNGASSGLYTTDGSHQIRLFEVNSNLIVGRYDTHDGNVSSSDPAAFAIYIDPTTGVMSVVQYVAIKHDDRGDFDESNDNGTNSNDAQGNDSPNPVQQSIIDGAVRVTVTVTDHDGDSVDQTFNVGSKIVFEDDGPAISITATGESSIQLTTQDADTIGTASDVAVSTANFGGVFTTTTSYGADGAGSTSLSYKLAVTGQAVNGHVDSGLDSQGQSIYLYNVNGTIVGSTSSSAGGITGANTIFSLTVDSNGVVTLTQYAEIDHPIGSDPSASGSPFDDQHASLADGLLSLTRSGSITDGDGDTAATSATVDLGGNIRFTDDGPRVTALADAISVDEANLPSDRNPTNTPGSIVAIDQSGFGSLHINWGADNGDAKHLAFAKDGNGHVIGPDLKSDGVTLLYEIHSPSDSPGNEQIVAYKAGDPNHTPVFSITLYESGNGGYAYVQYQNIDHSGSGTDTSQFNFNIIAYDADGDTVQQTLTINVKDDAPTAGSTSVAVDEDDLSTGNADVQDGDNLANPSPTAVNGHLTFTAGADGLKSLTFETMTGSVKTTGGADVTMNHAALTYVWVGNTLYATTDAGHPSDANSAFKVTITDPNTGAYTFTLLHNVDHPLTDDSANAPVKTAYEDNLDINLSFTVTDGDGDTKTGTLSINIDDDTPVILSPDAGSTSEANIATATAVAHGSLGIHFGADGPSAPAAPASSGTPHTINFDDAHNGTLPGNQYTHDGFTFHTDQGIANVTDHAGQMYGTAIMVTNNGNEPFTITQMDLGLFGTTNSVLADNVRLTGIDTHGNTIVVIFNVGATIGLGDAATTFHAAGTAFDGVSLSSLKIEPVLGWQDNNTHIFNGSVVVDNVVFNSGSAPLTHGAVSFTDLTTAINNVTIVDSDNHPVAPAALTSHGETIHYALLDSMTLVGYTGDTAPTAINGANVVFSVVLSQDAGHPNGAYDFTLHQPLDDLPSGVTDLDLTFNFTAKDGDGDAVSGQFTVDVKDDIPTAGSTSLAVDEDDLSTGNADVQDGDNLANPSPTVIDGHLPFTAGADGLKSLTFETMTGTVKTTGGADVTMNHVALTYVWVGNTLWATTDAGHPSDANSAFKVTITDPSTGAYSFTLLHGVDHPLTDDSAAPGKTAFEDNLDINLSFTVTDGDHDTKSTGTLAINIDDDVPVVASNGTNYITNGDFQAGNWSTPAWWGSVAPPDGVPGWSISGDPSYPPQNGINFERQAPGFLGLHSSTDQGMIDMGGSPGNYDLTQQVGAGSAPDLVNGQQYVLQLEVGAPFPSTAKMEVLWNGVVIGVIDTNVSSGQMEKFAFIVTGHGDPSADTVSFREIGEGSAPISGTVLDDQGNPQPLQDEGYHGTYIANVQMFALNGVVDEDALNNANAHGVGDSQPGDAPDGIAVAGNVTISGDLGVKWGADQYDVADSNGVQDGVNSTLTGRSLTFTNANVAVLGVNALTSDGEAISFVRTDNNTKLVGFVDSDHNGSYNAGDRLVIDVTLSDDGTGSFKFTLHDNLDHAPGASENDIALQFNFTATDSDGDSANGTFAVGVDDDMPVVTQLADAITVDEANLPTDRHPDPVQGTTTGIAQSGFGSLHINWGADNGDAKHLEFAKDGNGNVIGPDLKSDGAKLLYEIHSPSDSPGNEQIVAYKDGDPNHTPVFSITLYESGNGGYAYAQFQNIDHSGSGTDTSQFTFNIIAYDADGDAVQQTLTINVKDDVPVAHNDVDSTTAAQQTLTFDDIALSDGGEQHLASPYHGFNFIHTGVTNPMGSGPDASLYATHSGDNLAFIGEKNGVDLPDYTDAPPGAPLTIEHTDGNKFTALGAWFSSHDSGLLTITIKAYDTNNVLIGTLVADIQGGNGPTWIDMSSLGSVHHITMDSPAGQYFGFDDFSYRDDASVATGNVLTGVDGGLASDANATDGVADTFGADGFQSITWTGASAPNAGVSTIVGTYGTLTVDANGNYSYTLNANNPNVVHWTTGDADLTDSFTYTIKDGDGDTDTATLTIHSTGADDGAGLFNLTAAVDGGELTVFENDLANGSSPSAAALAQTGTFSFTTPDGIGDLTIGTTKIVTNGVVTIPGSPISTQYGEITITGVNLTTGVVSYTYTLTHNAGHDPVQGSNDAFDSVAVTVTDRDGDHASDTLSIKVVDDVPTAHSDVNAAQSGQTVTGNVITDAAGHDAAGADGIASIAWTNANNGTITGQHGTLTIGADGSYSYQAFAHTASGSDVFEYTIADGDGDTSKTTLTIDVTSTNTLPTAGNTTASVDDEGLAHGIPGNGQSSGDASLPSPENVANGTLPHDYQADGKASADPVNFAPMDGQHGTVGTESVTYHWDASTNTLVATSDTAGRGDIFKVVVDGGVDNGNGNYQLTLLKPVMHESGNGENDATVDLTYQVKDSSSDTATGKLTVTFDDDTPVAQSDTVTVEAGKVATVDIQFIVDRSLSMFASAGGNVSNVPGYSDDRMGLARYSMEQLLESNTQIEHVQIVRFGNTADGTVWMSKAEALAYIQNDANWTSSSGTNYDLALQQAMSSYGNGPTNPADKSLVYFLSDGAPDGNGIANGADDNNHSNNSVTTGEWENHVNSHGIDDVYAIGIGSGVSVANLEPVAYPNTDGPDANTTEDNVIVVGTSNVTNLLGTLQDMLGTAESVSGNVVTDHVTTGFGADGGHVQSIAIGGTTFTFTAGNTPGTGTIGESGTLPAGYVDHGTWIEMTTAIGGKLTFYFEDTNGHHAGDYSYLAPTNTAGTESIHYVVVDGDNDTAAADLTINVTVPPPTYALTGAPEVTEGGDLVFHLDLSHANATDTVFTIGTQNGTATGGADFETSNFEYSTNGGQSWVNAGGANHDQVTIATGQTSVLIRVDTTDDSVDEANNESMNLVVTGTSGTVASTGNDGTEQGLIDDNDAAPTVSISNGTTSAALAGIAAPSLQAVQEGDSVYFQVKISGASSGPVTVRLEATNDDSSNGPGGSADGAGNSDYQHSGFHYSTDGGLTWLDATGSGQDQVTIPAGTTSIIVRVDTVDDSSPENLEAFRISIDEVTGGAATIASGNASASGFGGTGEGDIGASDHTPSITSNDAFNVAENSTAVATITANDPDLGNTLTWSIVSGDDGAKFKIDAGTGALAFVTAPNFEAPNDVGGTDGNNVYVVTVRATDSEGHSVTQEIDVTVTDVNEQPSAGADIVVSKAENIASGTVLATVSATDPDAGGGNDSSNTFENLTYAIVGGNDAGLFTVNSSGAVSLASGKQLDYETSQQHVLTVRVSDGPGLFDDVQVTINVTDVNDAPTTNDVLVNAVEGVSSVAVVLSGGDVDGTVSSFKIDGLPTGGTLYSDAALTHVIASGGTVSVMGNSATVYFKPTTVDSNGTSTFQYEAVDNNGAHDATPGTATINIASVNDAPSGADKTIAINEDGVKTFAAADFGFSDTHDGNSFLSVTITTLPTNGALTLNGNAVTAGQAILVSDIPGLNFNPDPNESGAGYASFTFQVRDNGTTANGGVDTDQSPNTITINVASVDDAPVIYSPSDAQYVPASSSSDQTPFNRLMFADADTTGSVTVKITRSSGDSTFVLDGDPAGGDAVLQNSGRDVEITGTIAAVNAWLAGNHLTLDTNGNDSDDTFSISINDGTTPVSKASFDVDVFTYDASNGSGNDSSNNLAGMNVHVATLNGGSGNDTVYTSWSHVGTSATTYDGGTGSSDNIYLNMTGSQLQEILTGSSTRDGLQAFLSNPTNNALDLSDTSWHAKAQNFDTAHIELANLFSTTSSSTPSSNYVDIDTTWKSVITSTEIVGADGDAGNNLVIANAVGTLNGNGGNDVLVASNAGNTLHGGAGSDLLLGGIGADILTGDAGNDVLSGGGGADIFRWGTEVAGTANADKIVDYNFNAGDKLDVSALLDVAFAAGGKPVGDYIQVQASGNDLVVSVDTTGSHNFAAASAQAYTLVGLATNGPDPVKIYFEGHDHVITG